MKVGRKSACAAQIKHNARGRESQREPVAKLHRAPNNPNNPNKPGQRYLREVTVVPREAKRVGGSRAGIGVGAGEWCVDASDPARLQFRAVPVGPAPPPTKNKRLPHNARTRDVSRAQWVRSFVASL